MRLDDGPRAPRVGLLRFRLVERCLHGASNYCIAATSSIALFQSRAAEQSQSPTQRFSLVMLAGCVIDILANLLDAGITGRKEKISSTTGLRSTNVATNTNNPPVMASIAQCRPNNLNSFLLMDASFIN
jgi:hypothetical protein